MDRQTLLEIAVETALEAGTILREGASHLREVNFQDHRDVKLRADVESEALIRQRLGAATEFPVYGEELGGDPGLVERDEPYWVVDPLDGTYNYLRGCRVCGVSIGLLRGLEPLLGVIYNFNTLTCYSTCVTDGLWVNGRQVQPAWVDRMDQAALVTGLPAGMDRSPERMQAFLERIGAFKKVRMVGSAALAMAYVASGIFDVYYEEDIRLWDVAAGLALVKAGGGDFKLIPGNSGKPLSYDVWAGKGEFFGS